MSLFPRTLLAPLTQILTSHYWKQLPLIFTLWNILTLPRPTRRRIHIDKYHGALEHDFSHFQWWSLIFCWYPSAALIEFLMLGISPTIRKAPSLLYLPMINFVSAHYYCCLCCCCFSYFWNYFYFFMVYFWLMAETSTDTLTELPDDAFLDQSDASGR